MKQETDALEQSMHIQEFLFTIKKKSDHLINYFLFGFFFCRHIAFLLL